MNLNDISKNEKQLIELMIQNCPNTIVKIFKDNDRYIYTNENVNIMFSGSTSSGPVDEHTLIEAFK